MEKTTFGFIKNRLFITGLVVGIIFSAVVAILIVSLYQPVPEKQMLKGTMASWYPSVNDLGIVQWVDYTSSHCGTFVGVEFYNDPTHTVIKCRPESGRFNTGIEVRVTRVISGIPCSVPNGEKNGIWIVVNK